jgi:hypothetical protein
MKAPLRPMLLVVGALSLGGVVVLKNARASQASNVDTADSLGGKDGGSITLADKKEGGSIELGGKDGGSVELAMGKDGGSMELVNGGKDGGGWVTLAKKEGGSIELSAGDKEK